MSRFTASLGKQVREAINKEIRRAIFEDDEDENTSKRQRLQENEEDLKQNEENLKQQKENLKQKEKDLNQKEEDDLDAMLAGKERLPNKNVYILYAGINQIPFDETLLEDTIKDLGLCNQVSI